MKQFLISFYIKEFALEDYPNDIARSFIMIKKVMIRYSVPIHENMTTALEDMFQNSVKKSYFTLYFTLTFNVIALIFRIVYAFKFIFKASILKGQLVFYFTKNNSIIA